MTTYSNDHDLLISIDTKLNLFMAAQESMRADVTKKADQQDVVDHEARLRVIEGWVAKAIGIGLSANALMTVGGYFVLKKLFG